MFACWQHTLKKTEPSSSNVIPSCDGPAPFATGLDRDAHLIVRTFAHLVDAGFLFNEHFMSTSRAPSLQTPRASAKAPVLYFFVSIRLSDIVLCFLCTARLRQESCRTTAAYTHCETRFAHYRRHQPEIRRSNSLVFVVFFSTMVAIIITFLIQKKAKCNCISNKFKKTSFLHFSPVFLLSILLHLLFLSSLFSFVSLFMVYLSSFLSLFIFISVSFHHCLSSFSSLSIFISVSFQISLSLSFHLHLSLHLFLHTDTVLDQ